MKRTLGCLALLTVGLTLQAATVGREEMRDGEKYLILENESAKIAVWPAAGAAIVDYIDKRSGVDFAAKGKKGIKKGVAGYGWKELTSLRIYEAVDSETFGQLPYQAELIKGEGYAAILASCTSGHLRVEREMRLADDGTTLSVIIRHTNISDKPKTVWLRFHPCMSMADGVSPNAAILVPCQDPQTLRLRRLNKAMQDSNYMDIPGYWMAVNSGGIGMWMTFPTNTVMVGEEWNDDTGCEPGGEKPVSPDNFIPEIFPHPQSVEPGKSVELRLDYQPFVPGDKIGQFTMDLVPENERAAANRFLALARTNLAVVAPHTMNDFGGYGHKRRERFAFRDWGIVDAMMMAPAVQSIPIKTRLYAQAYEGFGKSFKVSYKLTIADTFGKVVKEQLWQYEGAPGARVIDKSEDFSIADLPDGRYTFTLAAFEGTNPVPVHQFTDTCKLAGTQRAAAVAARVKAESGVPLEKRERPFVTALRTMAVPAVSESVVPIGVEEASGVARQEWPVRVGVPFAAGVLAKGAPVALSGPDGKPVPVQTTVMGTWLDGSVKWLLVDFQATVPANSHVFYTLKANAKPAAAPAADLAKEEGGAIRVDTGAGQWAFAGGDAKLLGLFWADDIWWQTADGRQYRFEIKGEEAGISVVENGPQRSVVKVVGWYVPVSPTAGEAVARGEFRAEFCRGQAWFRLYHTFTFAGDPWKDALASTGVRFSGLLAGATEAGIDLDGKTVFQPKGLTLWQADEDHAVIETGSEKTGAGRRSTGAAVLKSAKGRAVVYHRNLWELFPKTVNVDAAAGAIAFEYWPKRAGALDWRPREDGWHSSSPAPQYLGVGVSRTHEFIVDSKGALAAEQYQAAFDEPVMAVVAPRYLCATRALEQLQPYDPNKAPELENHVSEAIDSYILNKDVYGWYGEWRFGAIPNVYNIGTARWAHYGRYAHILNELDICHGPWLAYLRSGDRKYLKFAEANTRHLLEVGTIRLSRLFPETAGMSRRHHECIWLGGADSGHSMLDPFLELYHATGYRPGFEAAERMARGMSSFRGGTDRYLNNPIGGMARMYLETQDPSYKKEADRLWIDNCFPNRSGWAGGPHGSRMTMYYSQINADCKRIRREGTGGRGSENLCNDARAQFYAETGDKQYAQKALAEFREPRVFQQYDTKRADPLLWSIAMHTQAILDTLRQLLYASGMIEDALKEERELLGDRGDPVAMPGSWVKEPLRCVIREDQDQEIKVQIVGTVGQTNGLSVQAFGPDGLLISRTTVPAGRHFPFGIKLPKDGKTGQYVVFVDWNNRGNLLSLPLTALPEVYQAKDWASVGLYFTRSPAAEPCEVSIIGERAVVFAADKQTSLDSTSMEKKEVLRRIGPEGVWLGSGGAGFRTTYAADKAPLVVSANAGRWFLPAPAALAVQPVP
jgi:hypothetical protein